MTTNVPFLLRFAQPFGTPNELPADKAGEVPATEMASGAGQSIIGQRESRFTRVRNETTDDE